MHTLFFLIVNKYYFAGYHWQRTVSKVVLTNRR